LVPLRVGEFLETENYLERLKLTLGDIDFTKRRSSLPKHVSIREAILPFDKFQGLCDELTARP
jgi:hypothetical protein